MKKKTLAVTIVALIGLLIVSIGLFGIYVSITEIKPQFDKETTEVFNVGMDNETTTITTVEDNRLSDRGWFIVVVSLIIMAVGAITWVIGASWIDDNEYKWNREESQNDEGI